LPTPSQRARSTPAGAPTRATKLQQALVDLGFLLHEYLHTLAHKDYQAWAQSFKNAGDGTRYNTLIEGFCDFFTLNVRQTVTPRCRADGEDRGPLRS